MQRLGRIFGGPRLDVGQRVQPLGDVEERFRLPVGALVLRLRRKRAAVELRIKLSIPDGQRVSRQTLLQTVEKALRFPQLDRRPAGQVAHRTGHLQHLFCRPAAAIPSPVNHQQLVVKLLLLVILPEGAHLGRVHTGVIGVPARQLLFVFEVFLRGDKMGEQLAAVDPSPEERIIGDAVGLVPAHLRGEHVAHAALHGNLGQRRRETKGIR